MLERLAGIHLELAEGRYPNYGSLAKKLEVSAKTVQRDLDYLRDRELRPIAYDGARRGFYYTEPMENVEMQIKEGELLALLVARQAVDSYKGTPYSAVLGRVFEQLTSTLGGEVSFPVRGLPEAISFRNTGAARVDADYLKVFEAVSRAVLLRIEMEFSYLMPLERVRDRRRVQPYHLTYCRGLWYLVAWDLQRAGWRTFALTRMSEVALSERRFARDTGFSAEKFFRDSFWLLRGERAVRVRIGFDAYASVLVRERVWHESQKFFEREDGTLELELSVSSFDEVVSWVLEFRGGARALEPAEFVEAVRAAAGRVLENQG